MGLKLFHVCDHINQNVITFKCHKNAFFSLLYFPVTIQCHVWLQAASHASDRCLCVCFNLGSHVNTLWAWGADISLTHSCYASFHLLVADRAPFVALYWLCFCEQCCFMKWRSCSAAALSSVQRVSSRASNIGAGATAVEKLHRVTWQLVSECLQICQRLPYKLVF